MNEWFEAERHVERAQEMYESGRLEEALRELRAALEANPLRGEWRFTLGQVLDALGRHAEAAEAYRRVLDHEGETPRVLNQLGAALLRDGKTPEALQALGRSAHLDPADPLPSILRIDAYRRIGDHDSAELMFYLACQASDAEPRAYLYMAWSLLDRNLPDRALGCLRRLRALDPREPELYATLGEAYWIKRDLDKARRAYGKQVRLYPADTEALLDLGRVLDDAGRPIEAAEKFRRVLQQNPRCAEAHLELGGLHLDAGRLDAAQVDLHLAVRLDPVLPLVHQKLAAVALLRGHTTEARAYLHAELSLGERENAEELADLLMDAGMHAHAAAELAKLVEATPGDSELGHRLAAALFLAGDMPGGIAACRRTLRLDPDHLPALQNLALAYLLCGRTRRAQCVLRRASDLDPGDPRTRRLKLEILSRRFLGARASTPA